MHEYRIKLKEYNSIYHAELVAISSAIDWYRSSLFSNFHLYRDSLSSYLSLQQLFPTDDLLFKIFENLQLIKNKTIYIGWIKAHVVIKGNERRDYLAKSVITDNIRWSGVITPGGVITPSANIMHNYEIFR